MMRAERWASIDAILYPTLAKSIGRLPDGTVTPADLDQGPSAKLPASPIGAALDLLQPFENPEGT